MADQKFKLSLSGKIIENKKFDGDEINDHFKIKQSFNLKADRSDSHKYDVEFTESESIFQITTADGLEWIGYGDEIPDLYGELSVLNRSGDSDFHMSPEIHQRGGTHRSGGESIRNAVLDVIVPKASILAAKEIAKIVDDKKCPNPGLHKIDAQGNTLPPGNIPTDQTCLILIHGTISSYEDGFKNIEPEQWNKMMEHYDGRVYAFNHPTLTVSPIENTLELLKSLPDSGDFDIISHSRGGLVADVLSRCDHRNETRGFDDSDIGLISKDFKDEAGKNQVVDAMHSLNALASDKNIAINKVVRVACPAQGTIILSDRLDHFLNAILTLIGSAVGSKLNPFYQYFKLFLLKVVEEKSAPETFPGLWSMVPESAFQIVNNKNVKISSELYCIAGDSKIGSGFLHSLKVILTNLYFWQENDFVVNTNSMVKGLTNRSHHAYHTIRNKEVQHFNYFSIPNHMEVVISALNDGSNSDIEWTLAQENFVDRGIVLKQVDLGTLMPQKETGKRPIVILVPGIMGSNIYFDDDKQWLALEEINKGALVKKLGTQDYDRSSAKSIISKYYKDLHDYLVRNNHDVVVHPFDWRRSLSECSDEFNRVMTRVMRSDHPVRVVSHSMGGLLVRQWKLDHSGNWGTFKNREESRWIMLGTPWGGSHLITEVLTGNSKRVKQLNLLDWNHSKRELLDSLIRHQGLLDLLPVTDDRIDKMTLWKELFDAAGQDNMSPMPADQLKYYNKYKTRMRSNARINGDDQDIIYYVAGQTDETVCDYEIKRSFFKGKHVKYIHTAEGDGSVTWETGIPPGLNADHLYFVKVEHGDLANEPSTFEGIKDLIERGKTNQKVFSKSQPRIGNHRGGDIDSTPAAPALSRMIYSDDPLDNIFGISKASQDLVDEPTKIQVEVFNGDLKWAQYPLMVGHFDHDGIVSAERTLDRYLGYKLSERHLMGFYPGRIGEQDIIIDHKANPKGAIVIGLGDKDDLTGYNLSKSVEKAMLKYAVFYRDNDVVTVNPEMSTSVSTLIVGSNYGKLPMKESIRSILIGIQNANEMIREFESLNEITKVEFVDYYEDNAYECYKVLQDLEDEVNMVDIVLKSDITVGYRYKKRLLRDESHSWWQSFSTELKVDTDCDGRSTSYLDFGTYNRQANASREKVYVDMTLAKHIADELSTVQEWDLVSSKVIFEMLLPNRYKDFIRNHRNIEWRLDIKAATFPWEMFHDFAFGAKPTFIESGLIRQLYSINANIRPALVRQKSALVIADPVFEEGGLPQLKGAEIEGGIVSDLLTKSKFQVVDRIKSNPLDIIKSLFSGAFKVVHIASHGLYDDKDGRVGIAIGKGQLLTPGTLNQMTNIPEFVFVNCCHSGKIVPEDESYVKSRNRLAANIGTQLIEMGVKAVVVAGWAVYDPAAQIFATTLYQELLEGAYFGDAAKKARSDCYYEHPNYNTWGAYQCYGDQFYRLNSGSRSSNDEAELTLEQEIVMELDNVLSSARSLEITINDKRSIKRISQKMQVLVERAEKLGKYTTQIIEREAMILNYLGRYTQAVVKYKELFNQDDGEFNVKNMDVYCNIRAKNLVTCASGTCSITDDSIESILHDMESISIIGQGARRLSTMGSTYKRAAMLVNDLPTIRKYLYKSADKYRRAIAEFGLDSREAIYPVISFITVSVFHNSGIKKNRIDIDAAVGGSVEEYLKKWIAIVDRESSDRTNVYDQLAKIQLRLVAILIGYGDAEEYTQDCIYLYQRQISRCISIRDLIAEIEGKDLNIFMCEKFRAFHSSKSHFVEMKKFLEQYYKH